LTAAPLRSSHAHARGTLMFDLAALAIAAASLVCMFALLWALEKV
jgi:hypothetical protein